MGAREDGAMPLAWYRFNGARVGRRFFGIPRADVFAAIICLPIRIFQEGIKFFEEVINIYSKQFGMSQGSVIGEAQE